METSFIKLKCPVQHYEWGERKSNGREPFISGLLGEKAGDLPWAELWMGAHPAASSILESKDGIKLIDAIAVDPDGMTGHDGKLGFLLKILCCSRPLSIQSHPDIESAKRLHGEFPADFPDDNHKPEVLWALSPFRLLAGFRPLEEAAAGYEGKKAISNWADLLRETGDYRKLCSHILQMNEDQLRSLTAELMVEADMSDDRDALFVEIADKYPADCGTLFVYLLNYMHLEPGQAVFVPANTPHAYLEGQGVECMASSDNVIRAGLTPKTVRRDLLMETLDFSPSSPSAMLAVNGSDSRYFLLDCSPDFRLSVVRSGDVFAFKSGSPAIICVLAGSAELSDGDENISAGRGEVYFKAASADSAVMSLTDSSSMVVVAEE